MLPAPIERLALGLRRVMAPLRRPEWMVFLPGATLAAFWLGGEGFLVLMAVGVPMIFTAAGAFRFTEAGPAPAPELEDGLTGLALRPQLTQHLDRALADGPLTGRSTACLVLQFDEIEQVVDRHGRAAQLEILSRCAERLCSALREGDIVARLEGGGFAVALAPVRRLELESAIQLSTRLQAALSAPISIDAMRVHISVSVGFCLGDRAPLDLGKADGKAVLDAAQIAADEARRNGPAGIRGWVPDMARTRADRDARREELETALEEGQIRAWFQPQISTDTGAISGMEALARWHHPERGVIPPAEFLPALIENGLADRLGEVMLIQSLTALTRWDKAGYVVPSVSVNFSEHELRDPRLAERLKWELDRFGLTPDRLTVEILETVVARTDNDLLVRNIAALARMGCGVDLDDFGTGNAAIPALRRFAVKRLKIDRSFVTRCDADREQQRMAAAILSLAEGLALECVAEGVETPAEHAMMAQLGCRHVQGFGIARPMPVEETMDWIERHSARKGNILRLTKRTRS